MKIENQFWCLEYDRNNNESYDESVSKELYYDLDKKKWVNRKEYTGYWYPATFPCHSYRAAKRHLRKHDEIPKGTRFRLCSKFIGFDRYLTKK